MIVFDYELVRWLFPGFTWQRRFSSPSLRPLFYPTFRHWLWKPVRPPIALGATHAQTTKNTRHPAKKSVSPRKFHGFVFFLFTFLY